MKCNKFHIFLIVLLILISCNKRDIQKNKIEYTDLVPPDTAGAVKGDWVVIAIFYDPQRLNPWVAQSTFGITGYIVESLNEVNEQTFELEPLLASLPEVSADHLVYTYTVNPQAKFSDGTPVTGDDIIFSFKATKNPYTDDPYLRTLFESVKSIEYSDGNSNKVKINLSKPNFRTALNFSNLSILPKHVLDPDNLTDRMSWEELVDIKSAESNPSIKKFAEFINSPAVSTESRYLVGTGPYRLEKWDSRQAVTLARNEYSWHQSEVPCFPDKLIFKIITDETAAFISVKNKEVDAAYTIEPAFANDTNQLRKFDLSTGIYPYPHYVYIGWNELIPLFKDKRVRMALACLFDKKGIGDKLLTGMAEPIESHVYYKDKKYLNTELPVSLYDPGRAKKLLKEAGWEDTDGDNVLDKVIDGKKTDFKFTFLVENFDIEKKAMIVYTKELENAGIEADIQPLESSVLFEKVTRHEFEAVSDGTGIGLIPNPSNYFHSGKNDFGFMNKESDSLLDMYDNEFEEARRVEVLKKWQKLIFDEHPVLFLWTFKRAIIYDKRFRNVRMYTYGPNFNEWWVPKEMQRYK